ncbi:MAG: hypothetical protein JRC99_00080 [Deltaproteobacteria bacterium]|nr:hypothetical protein [Deltaproteobacteria bacterium]
MSDVIPKKLIEVICNVPGGRYRGGVGHTAGRKLYPVGTFNAAQIREFEDDPGFNICEVEEAVDRLACTPPSPLEGLDMEEAIDLATAVLQPFAEDYGTEDGLREKIVNLFAPPVEVEGAPDDHPFNELVDTCESLISILPRDESKFAGKVPKTKALSAMVGWKVTGQERDRAMALLDEQRVEGKE